MPRLLHADQRELAVIVDDTVDLVEIGDALVPR